MASRWTNYTCDPVTHSADAYPKVHESYEVRHVVGWVLTTVCSATLVISTAAFVVRRRLHPIKARSKLLVMLQSSVALVLAIIRVGVVEIVGPANAPCDMNFVTGMLFPLFAGPPALVRLMRIHQLYLLNRRKQKLSSRELSSLSDFGKLRSRSSTFFLTIVYLVCITPSLIAILVLYVDGNNLGKGCVNCPLTFGNMLINFVQAVAYIIVFSILIYKTRHMYDAFHVRRELVHWTLWWSLVLVLMTPLMAITESVEAQKAGWFDASVFFLIGAFGCQIISVALPALGTYNRGPYSGYILELQGKHQLEARARHATFQVWGWKAAGGPGGAPKTDVVNPLSRQDDLQAAGSASSSDGGAAREGCATSAVKYGGLKDPEAELSELLRNPDGLRAFTAHLTSEFSVENIRFWIDVEGYRARFESSSREERSERAVLLYDTYIAQNAPLMINIKSDVVRKLQAAIGAASHGPEGSADKDPASNIQITTFDAAQAEIFKLMAQDSYRRFLRSPRFAAFLAAASDGDGDEAEDEKPPSVCVRIWLAFIGRARDDPSLSKKSHGRSFGEMRGKDVHAAEFALEMSVPRRHGEEAPQANSRATAALRRESTK